MIGCGILLAVAAMGPALVGCGNDSTHGHAGQGQAVASSGTKEASPSPARPYIGKPRPPVTVLLKGQPALEPGVPGELRLTVRAGVGLSGPSLLAEGDAGLTVTGVETLVPDTAGRERQAASFEEERVTEYRILVTPSSGGYRSVSGQVRFFVGGVEQAAPFRVGVRVPGAAALPTAAEKPQTDVASDATGDLIDSIPAETMIR
jgi:hypothetical protein